LGREVGRAGKKPVRAVVVPPFSFLSAKGWQFGVESGRSRGKRASSCPG